MIVTCYTIIHTSIQKLLIRHVNDDIAMVRVVARDNAIQIVGMTTAGLLLLENAARQGVHRNTVTNIYL